MPTTTTTKRVGSYWTRDRNDHHRALRRERREREERGNCVSRRGGRFTPPVWLDGGGNAHKINNAMTAAEADFAAQAEGLRLLRSTRSRSGYLFVEMRTKCIHRPYIAVVQCCGRIGHFSSAPEAALAAARHPKKTPACSAPKPAPMPKPVQHTYAQVKAFQARIAGSCV